MTSSEKNVFIMKFLELRKSLRICAERFTQKFDKKNSLSLLSKVIQQMHSADILNESQKNELIEKVATDSENCKQTLKVIDEIIETKLNNLGYQDNNNAHQNISAQKTETQNIVEQYTEIITSIEKMISELEKTMAEVDEWINKISTLIVYEIKDDKKENREEEEETLDFESLNQNLK